MTLLEQINQIADQEPKNLTQQTLKLMEEVGEAAQALLSSQGASGSGYKGLTTQNTQEEFVDVLLVTLAILRKLQPDQAITDQLIQQKVAKWAAKQTANN
ncbi:MazG-like family protein [Loigolactobacillus bifermentans]|uniref:NTP pyrophosphohydrolase MazG putative catalytic core domain-containing protein n=1 Tax=Loigolactobacillus bifermentans DSM 20003 TaxID=1423726 RepID=A0A0R1GR48_9LACO|nr:MazG-like family protein [Loigolactobacillus bifermentans]KRK36376.1 hypothetical protein FC07_GL003057 [Loigolactobacillus bifermentans DSM 20003]QGG61013.1 hypothetical protein LB003_11375 [Loigolactobacillus bifermentans]